MSLYAVIARNRYPADAAGIRAQLQGLIDYFTSWTPPDGVTMVSLYASTDMRMAISVWESESHAALTTLTAQYLAWQDIEIIPVVSPEEGVPALVAGGLITAR